MNLEQKLFQYDTRKELCEKYRGLKAQQEELKKEIESVKADLIEAYGGSFEEHGLKCKLVTRQGSLDAQKLKFSFGLSDEQLDSFRKAGSESWTITQSKRWAD